MWASENTFVECFHFYWMELLALLCDVIIIWMYAISNHCTGYAIQYFHNFQIRLSSEYIKFIVILILSKMVYMDIRCKLLNLQFNFYGRFKVKQAPNF